MNHRDSIRRLNTGALEFVVEDRILIRSKIEPRRVVHHANADVPGKAIRQQCVEVAAGSSQDRAEREKKKPLDVVPLAPAQSHFPAFVDLLRRQLHRDYNDEDLNSEGLKIFTTLDPIIQTRAEQALAKHLERLDPTRSGQAETLQGAVVVTHPGTGDVYAVVGDRRPRSGGFNRAVSAERHIGSIVKPAVFLAALEQGRYNLATIVDDGPLRFEAQPNDFWEPQNYDNAFRGSVPFYEALSQSYNVSTVRVGLDAGVNSVRRVIQELGVDKPLNPFPSLLLGATEMTPHFSQ